MRQNTLTNTMETYINIKDALIMKKRYNVLYFGGMVMNKTELVAAIAEKTALSKKDADSALKAFIEVVGDELGKGEKVQLAGFGTFEVSERAEREGINPRTKETITIPASKAPKFKAMKALKEKVNN